MSLKFGSQEFAHPLSKKQINKGQCILMLFHFRFDLPFEIETL
jgi:hypothetical protein